VLSELKEEVEQCLSTVYCEYPRWSFILSYPKLWLLSINLTLKQQFPVNPITSIEPLAEGWIHLRGCNYSALQLRNLAWE
jgi:hypothetical protein